MKVELKQNKTVNVNPRLEHRVFYKITQYDGSDKTIAFISVAMVVLVVLASLQLCFLIQLGLLPILH